MIGIVVRVVLVFVFYTLWNHVGFCGMMVDCDVDLFEMVTMCMLGGVLNVHVL